MILDKKVLNVRSCS